MENNNILRFVKHQHQHQHSTRTNTSTGTLQFFLSVVIQHNPFS